MAKLSCRAFRRCFQLAAYCGIFALTTPAHASAIMRAAVRHPLARPLRGGPHGPDGRPYDAQRSVPVPVHSKALRTLPSSQAAADHRVTVPSYRGLTHVLPAALPTMAAGPRIQPLYLKGCSSQDYSAIANLGVGKGKQSLRLIVDSGSTTLAVASNKCRDCNVQPTYTLVSGSTDNIAVEAHYGSGQWRGVIVEDRVALGFAPGVSMRFGDILAQEDFFRSTNCTYGARAPSISQGIVGVGPADLILPGTASYFFSILPNVSTPTFAVALCDIDGYLHLGTTPIESAAAPPFFTPMVPSYYYSVSIADLEVGSQPLGGTYDDFGPVVVDTGTSAIILPPNAYTAFTQAVATATDNALPVSFFDSGECATLPPGTNIAELNSELPSLGFAFFNPATPDEPTWLSLPATNSYLLLEADPQKNLVACAGVVNSGPKYPQTILGNTIMRNMLTIFDIANGQVGFAMTHRVCAD